MAFPSRPEGEDDTDGGSAWLKALPFSHRFRTVKKLARIIALSAVVMLAPRLAVAGSQKLQVFVLAGQSNMQGHARVTTFRHLGMDPATAPLLKAMTDEAGNPKVCDRVWISALGCESDERKEKAGKLSAGYGAGNDKIGPEFTFGLTLQSLTDAPILLIKTAWGGKSLHTDFRPPGAGPYVFNGSQLAGFAKQGRDPAVMKAEKDKATGAYYRLMVEHVKSVLGDIKRVVPGYDSAQGYELAGFVWFQGWNDMVDGGVYPDRDKPGGYDAYSQALTHFIRDVRSDLNAPRLPFVIGVMGVDGPTAAYRPDQARYKSVHQNFRDAMAAPAKLPEFQGNVTAVLTESYWDQELSGAKARDGAVRQEAKKAAADQQLGPEQERATYQKLRTEKLSARDREILEAGISNLEFHYLGSAKILGGIGKGFAEAVTALRRRP